MRRGRAVGMAMVMVGMIVGSDVGHSRTLYYNITGVHVLAAARQAAWALRLRLPMQQSRDCTLSLTMAAGRQNQFRVPIEDTVARIMRATTSV